MNKHKHKEFQKQGFWNKRSLGQNFLINPHIIDKIVTTADIQENDTIIEVGPGTGNLTKELAKKARRVIAIEKDERLIPVLKQELKYTHNIKIILEDVLNYSLIAISEGVSDKSPEARLLEYKIVANIPYHITSNFLRKVFEEWPKPKLIVLTIQKEVAQRIMAKPPHMNLLALSVQYYSKPEIISYISKNNFRPVPKVDSAIIKLMPKFTKTGAPEARLLENRKLFELMRVGFSEKRKQLAPILSKKLKVDKEKILESFSQAGIGATVRAENLSLEEWKNLQNLIDNNLDSDRITNKVTGS